MKRIKTWKRWDYKAEPLSYQHTIRGMGDTVQQYRVLKESDYRKMLAVYNAAIKYYNNLSGDLDVEIENYEAFKLACEKARK